MNCRQPCTNIGTVCGPSHSSGYGSRTPTRTAVLNPSTIFYVWHSRCVHGICPAVLPVRCRWFTTGSLVLDQHISQVYVLVSVPGFRADVYISVTVDVCC